MTNTSEHVVKVDIAPWTRSIEWAAIAVSLYQ